MSLRGKSLKNVLGRQSSRKGEKGVEERKEPTLFQMRVYDCIRVHVPRGYVTSYGVVAKALDPPSSARAVGQALRVNPYAPEVPCHRVITNDLKLGGFRGSQCDVLAKESLLKEEGVLFDKDGKLVNKSCFLETITMRT